MDFDNNGNNNASVVCVEEVSSNNSSVGVGDGDRLLGYRDLLRDFENLKEKYRLIRERYDEGSERQHLESGACRCQNEIMKYKTLYQEMLNERTQFKQQCTQAIKQWDQALRERNQYKDALCMAQRKHDEAVKEVNQVISVKLKASKDLKRLTDERNAAMHEYSLIMSERDTVHKEMEKLQNEVSAQKKRVSTAESQSKLLEVDRRKMYCHIEILKREIENSLIERDRAIKEVHELREKIGIPGGGLDFGSEDETHLYLKNCKNFISKIDTDRVKSQNVLPFNSSGNLVKSFNQCETLDEANAEICRLLKSLEKLEIDLHDSRIEADIDKGRRDLAFSERDKILLEREAIRALCDKLRYERDRADCDLAESIRDSAELKSNNRKLSHENSKLRNRLDELKKERPFLSSPIYSSTLSQDSAIDSDLSIWETKTCEICLNGIYTENDLGFSISEVSDESQQSLLRVVSVSRSSDAYGKLMVNDYILTINDIDLRGLSRQKVLEIVHNSGPHLKFLIRRKKQSSVESNSEDYDNTIGLIPELGIYVSRILSDSLADTQSTIRPGDRILSLNGWSLQSGGFKNLNEVISYLNSHHTSISLSFVKASGEISHSNIVFKNSTDKEKPFSTSSMVMSPNQRFNESFLFKDLKKGNKKRKDTKEGLIFGGTWPRVKIGPTLDNNLSIQAKESERDRILISKLLSDLPVYVPDEVKYVPEGEESNQYQKRRFFKQPDDASNASVDNSVKSAHTGQEVLEKYLRRQPKSIDEYSSRKELRSPSHHHHHHLVDSVESVYRGSSRQQSGALVKAPSPKFIPIHNRESLSFSSNHYSNAAVALQFPKKQRNQSHIYHHPNLLYDEAKQRREGSISTRIRIPSNTSVASNSSVSKVSTSSMDKSFNKCSSPLPIYSIEYLSTDGRISESLHLSRKSVSGEIRQISIQKSSEQLGFTIEEGAHKGVFVSSVNDNSLAQLVGLQVGDQLLDVCGINLRSCGKEKASLVLHQVGNSITLKVQFNPEDFLLDAVDIEEDCSSEDDDVESSSSITPQNSPPDQQRQQLPPPSYSTLMKQRFYNASPPYEPRLVYPALVQSSDLGVRLVGGNAVGIFIHSVEITSPAHKAGLRSADQILEYDGVDLRHATAEQAAYELAKPAEKEVCLYVQYNPDKYQAIKDKPGDSYYIRSLFDRLPEVSRPPQLSFCKDDILYVDNTMYNGVPGNWSAWIVDPDGNLVKWGVIPSKYKVEEELLSRKSSVMLGGSSDSERRSWTSSTRRSFFKRKKMGSRSGSIPKELASYSDMGSLTYSDSGNLCEDVMMVHSYVRVEKFDGLVTRPVLVIGPYADIVIDKLVSEYPHKFTKCETELIDSDQECLEKGIQNNVIIDARRIGTSRFEVTTLRAVKEITDRNQHCILNIHIESVERLTLNQIYPIVLLIKFKSIKQIREMKDPRYSLNKMSHKDAKNIYEYTAKLESEHRHLISDIVHAGANLMLICTQIASQIDQEQAKTLWVPSGSIW